MNVVFFSQQVHQLSRDEIMVEIGFAEPRRHIEYIELAALPPIIQIANKMMEYITSEYLTPVSIINNKKRKLMRCALLEVR